MFCNKKYLRHKETSMHVISIYQGKKYKIVVSHIATGKSKSTHTD